MALANNYSEKLSDPRWQKKRLEILERDEWNCQICHDSTSTLVVHHRKYLPNTDPWDYPDDLLITLCEDCHKVERESRPEFEKTLLDVLRKNFFADDIRRLALGFSNLELLHASEVVACAYEEALSSPKIQQELIDNVFSRPPPNSLFKKKRTEENRRERM